ncbi:hypothetical protein ACEPAG_3270 [Sanghuangporus baumii]
MAVFQPLEDIFTQVVEAASRQASGLAQTFVLRLLPNDVPQSERASKTRPDGCVVLKEAEDLSQEADNIVYRWYDFGLTCEFKLRDTDDKRDDNVTKIVYSMQHTMTLDPCKRFTFGITIENTNMRLWFCSRAIMVVSEAFNFITQHEILVHVFLSLAFASKPELGWDPTIRVVANLHDSFLVLRDCAIALKFIHGSGWIHRDISAGNVYYFDGRGLIGDLEYAKKITIDETHQMRTGTPDFMAIEVMSNCYLFLPSRYSIKAHKSLLEAKQSNKDPNSVLPQCSGRPDFVQNEAHDIESLWQQRHARKVWIQRIFPSGVSTTRQHFLIDEEEFHEGVSWLPAMFREPANELDSLRDCLVGCYHEFEAAFPRIFKEVFNDLNNLAIGIFELCMGSATDTKISSYKLLGKQRQEALSRPVPPPIPVALVEPGKAIGSAPKRRALKDAPAIPIKALRMQRVLRPRQP